MWQLTLDRIYRLCTGLKEQGEDLSQYQVYLGDDDELNGIHSGGYINILSYEEKDGEEGLLELIEENPGNVEFKGKGILIS